MKTSLAELSCIKALQAIKEMTDCTFSFEEKKSNGKNVASILIKYFSKKNPCGSKAYLRGTDILKIILPAYEEFKKFNQIRIIGLNHDKISDDAYDYLYDFLRKTPDFKTKILLGVAAFNHEQALANNPGP